MKQTSDRTGTSEAERCDKLLARRSPSCSACRTTTWAAAEQQNWATQQLEAIQQSRRTVRFSKTAELGHETDHRPHRHLRGGEVRQVAGAAVAELQPLRRRERGLAARVAERREPVIAQRAAAGRAAGAGERAVRAARGARAARAALAQRAGGKADRALHRARVELQQWRDREPARLGSGAVSW